MLKISQHERDGVCEMHGAFIEKGIQLTQKIMWHGCPECTRIVSEKKEKEAKEKEAKEAQERFERTLSRSGIPIRFRSKNFENFIADSSEKERVLALAQRFAENFDEHYKNGSSAIFSGLPGTGKSHLALAIAQSIMSSYTVFYTSAIDAVRMVRDTWRKNSEKSETQVLEMLSGVGLLILDEVGVQYGTEAEQVTLFDIIDKRYRDMMPMILLTNQDKEGMKKFLGDRSFDRLREGGTWAKFEWPSHRPLVKEVA